MDAPDGRSPPKADAGDPLDYALALAFRQLSRRDCTIGEIGRRLASHDVDSSIAGQAIGQLCEQGYLDDLRYARLFTADKRELEHWGNERIRRTLRDRGIDPELIERTLAEGAGESELERALAVLRRRFPSPPRDRRERDRALGMMIRKGYDSELALDALAAYQHAGGDANSL